jgi:hypothetical protein
VGSNPTRRIIRPALHNTNVRSCEEVRWVQSLLDLGLNDCQVSRLTGIPRRTIQGWRNGHTPRRGLDIPSCARCGHAAHRFDDLPSAAYTYLLGMYLGDGYLARCRRGVYRLSIAMDARYPGIIASCQHAGEEVIGLRSGVIYRDGGSCANVYVHSKQWPCLFPQHGPGRKHERTIALVDWQQRHVATHPKKFLRGLIESDGCRGINRVTVNGKAYAYPRYTFCNASADIRSLFCDTCDLLGVEWRQMNARNISVARRDSVAFLDSFIGPKR